MWDRVMALLSGKPGKLKKQGKPRLKKTFPTSYHSGTLRLGRRPESELAPRGWSRTRRDFSETD